MRAFLVLGPEGSGTRLLTRLLIAGGCDGDAEHVQRWDADDPHGPLVVWRRSLPASRAWPDLVAMESRLTLLGYSVERVCIVRDEAPCILSQLEAGLVRSEADGRKNIRQALSIIAGLRAAARVTYAGLVANPVPMLRWLYGRLELTPEESVEAIAATVDGSRDAARWAQAGLTSEVAT